ncbi:MAG TPA: YetF domain-containing protein, partial [Ureibacillus sp.]|nr:YetF domain-containing protein [Ureibacillus sp.]
TVDQLEMTLRQQNVKNLSDVDYATLEPNGQIGYILKEEAQPASKKDIQLVQQEVRQLAILLNSNLANQIAPSDGEAQPSLFQEVAKQSKSKNSQHPNHLK